MRKQPRITARWRRTTEEDVAAARGTLALANCTQDPRCIDLSPAPHAFSRAPTPRPRSPSVGGILITRVHHHSHVYMPKYYESRLSSSLYSTRCELSHAERISLSGSHDGARPSHPLFPLPRSQPSALSEPTNHRLQMTSWKCGSCPAMDAGGLALPRAEVAAGSRLPEYFD